MATNGPYAADVYALCGKTEKALGLLQRCAALGLPNYKLFSRDPLLRGLAGDEAWQAFLTELRREHDSYCDELGLERDKG